MKINSTVAGNSIDDRNFLTKYVFQRNVYVVSSTENIYWRL